MSNTFYDNEKLPSFSYVVEVRKALQAIMKPIADVVLKFEEIMRPFREFAESVQVRFEEMTAGLLEAKRLLDAAERLGEAQYVYWNHMTEDFINTIMDSQNINKTLREILTQDRFKIVDDTIKKCRDNEYMYRYVRLFDQAIMAFKNSQSDLAVIGLVSIIDGLLTDVSENHTTRIATRANIIMDKLEQNETIDSDEYALMTLMLSFQKTLETFSANSDFRGKEPKGLNRHWIMHGRSRRRKTKLDCVKLINFIYGILLIDKLGKEDTDEVDECKN
ncbi:MAG: hypothetical protein J1E61_10605 [Lachnospiraceae bacterium]|nr:hypothetical protein [Lachnospiraceae bacterium]